MDFLLNQKNAWWVENCCGRWIQVREYIINTFDFDWVDYFVNKVNTGQQCCVRLLAYEEAKVGELGEEDIRQIITQMITTNAVLVVAKKTLMIP